MDGFPLDARTLLDTPRIIELSKTDSGEYLHYGLEHALKQQLHLCLILILNKIYN